MDLPVFQVKAGLTLLLASCLPAILFAASSELAGGGERLVSVSRHVGTQKPSPGRFCSDRSGLTSPSLDSPSRGREDHLRQQVASENVRDGRKEVSTTLVLDAVMQEGKFMREAD